MTKEQLMPAIIQDVETSKVLMFGYMNDEAIEQTIQTGCVTFYNPDEARLWMKGKETGDVLRVVRMEKDCDQKAYLIKVYPSGAVCKKGTDTCWGEENTPSYGFLSILEHTIEERIQQPSDESYVSSLYQDGIQNIAQKVGEGAIKTVLQVQDNQGQKLAEESANLIFHLLLLLKTKGMGIDNVVKSLQERSR